jgi:hypothetical protein
VATCTHKPSGSLGSLTHAQPSPNLFTVGYQEKGRNIEQTQQYSQTLCMTLHSPDHGLPLRKVSLVPIIPKRNEAQNLNTCLVAIISLCIAPRSTTKANSQLTHTPKTVHCNYWQFQPHREGFMPQVKELVSLGWSTNVMKRGTWVFTSVSFSLITRGLRAFWSQQSNFFRV